MDHSSYVSLSAAIQTQHLQKIKMNNLANAQTPGFRADFLSISTQKMNSSGCQSRAYAISEGMGSFLASGAIRLTEQPLDIVLSDGAWLAVQDAQGEVKYSRRGDLRVMPDGLLVDGVGHPVIGTTGPISLPPFQDIRIAEDGRINIIPIDANSDELVLIDQIQTIVPRSIDLIKNEDGLFSLKEDAVFQEMPCRIRSGFLEESNVNAIGELFELLHLVNHHELNLKLIEMAKSRDERSSEIMQLG